jgi:hypothetical protein
MAHDEWWAALDRCRAALAARMTANTRKTAEALRLEGVSPWAAAAEVFPSDWSPK